MILKNKYSAFSLTLLLLTFFTVSLPVTTSATTGPLKLFFSGNVQGETEPCG